MPWQQDMCVEEKAPLHQNQQMDLQKQKNWVFWKRFSNKTVDSNIEYYLAVLFNF